MIGKKVMNAKGGASKAGRIGRLVDYIRVPERALSDEKCAYYGARGFVTDSPGGHRAEMIALAQDAVRSPDPVNHYILSWREGELPLEDQIEQAVDLFLDELGLQAHQVLYGLHSDTDNYHLHIAVNRVHPDTLAVVKINRGFDVEAVHKAVARIEHAQGWMSEQRARYIVSAGGELVRAPREHAQARQPSQRSRDREVHMGEPSAERIAIEVAGPIIARATSWQELHTALADKGMRYERAGSGAKVFVGQIPVKASRIAREASFGRLEKRLGAYRPPDRRLWVAKSQDRPLSPELPELPEHRQYHEQRAAHHAVKSRAREQLRAAHDAERKALRERQWQQRSEVLSGSWRGRGHLLNGLRAALAEEQQVERRSLRQRHARERQGLYRRHPAFHCFEQWLRGRGQPVLAEQWRYRDGARELRGHPQSPPQQAVASSDAFVAAWQARERARREALGWAWRRRAQEVQRQKRVSKQRWATVRLLAKGRLAGSIWALQARMADQRDWRRLHERHREAVRDLERELPRLDWVSWRKGLGRGQPAIRARDSDRSVADVGEQRDSHRRDAVAGLHRPVGRPGAGRTLAGDKQSTPSRRSRRGRSR